MSALGPRLTLTVGVPGCGKSFWASAQQHIAPDDVVIVERDVIREELTGSRRIHTHEMDVTRIAQTRAVEALQAGKWVIVSDTNLVGRYRKAWVKIADMFDITVNYRVFNTPIEECIARDAERPDPVGESVILAMAAKMSLP